MEITFIQENITVQEFLDRFMDILAQIQLVETFQFDEKYGYKNSFPQYVRDVNFIIQVDDGKLLTLEDPEMVEKA
jgi:hypothetical protein